MLIFFVLTVFFQDICPQKVIRNVDKNLHLKMHIAVIYKQWKRQTAKTLKEYLNK